MEKIKVRGLVPLVVAAITVAAFLSSCNLILNKASVRFTNQTNVVLAPVSLGTASVGSLGTGITSGDYFLDSGTYTLSATYGLTTTITWPGVTVTDPKSYMVVIFGTTPYLAAQITED